MATSGVPGRLRPRLSRSLTPSIPLHTGKNTLLAHLARAHEGTEPTPVASLPSADLVPSLFSAPATRAELQDFAVLSPATISAVAHDPAIASTLPPSATQPAAKDESEKPGVFSHTLAVDVVKAGVTREGEGDATTPPTPESSAGEEKEKEGRPKKQARRMSGEAVRVTAKSA